MQGLKPVLRWQVDIQNMWGTHRGGRAGEVGEEGVRLHEA